MASTQPQPFTFLRERRRRRGLTKTGLSKLTGISISHLSMVESGQRRAGPEVFARLAAALGVTIDDLIDHEPDVPSSARAAAKAATP